MISVGPSWVVGALSNILAMPLNMRPSGTPASPIRGGRIQTDPLPRFSTPGRQQKPGRRLPPAGRPMKQNKAALSSISTQRR